MASNISSAYLPRSVKLSDLLAQNHTWEQAFGPEIVEAGGAIALGEIFRRFITTALIHRRLGDAQ